MPNLFEIRRRLSSYSAQMVQQPSVYAAVMISIRFIEQTSPPAGQYQDSKELQRITWGTFCCGGLIVFGAYLIFGLTRRSGKISRAEEQHSPHPKE